jgi:hypothetical protein
LHRLLGILRRAQDAITVQVEFALVTVDQVLEGLLVALLGSTDQFAVHANFLPTLVSLRTSAFRPSR